MTEEEIVGRVSEKTFTSYTLLFSKPAESKEEIPSESSDDETYVSDTSWPEFDIPGSWGTYGLEDEPWNDSDKPVVRFKNYDDIVLNEEEKNGMLTERIISSCSSYLDRCPQTGKYVLCKCNLSKKNLTDISILTFHHYLQYLDLSGNQLTNLTALSQLPFLMYLDVSRNILTDLLRFKPPFNLTYVNFSNNYVDVIPDLGEFWSIVYLDLSHNEIYKIRGLGKLKYLRYLDLSYNKIEALQNLNNMRVTHLNLEHNKIDSFEEGHNVGLRTLNDLIFVNLSKNSLRSLRLFNDAKALQKLIMTDNEIDYLYEVEYLKYLQYLTEVDFRRNPIVKRLNYYEVCLNCIQSLVVLDGAHVPTENKVLVKEKHKPSPLTVSNQRYANLFLLEQLNNCEVNNMILPFTEAISPMIILVGPPGSGQKKLLQEFYKKYKQYLRMGVSHTTRPMCEYEIEGLCYYFVSEEKFEDMTRKGEFVTVSNIFGYAYGFTYEELMKDHDKKTVLIFHTDLVGALNFRLRNFRPILVLTLYLKNSGYYAELLKKYCYEQWLARNEKILRIMNDSKDLTASTVASGTTVEIQNILSDIIATLPDNKKTTIKARKTSVKFLEPVIPQDNVQISRGSSEESFDYQRSSEESDELICLIDEVRRRVKESWLEMDKQVFHSISEIEILFEPILSVISEHTLDEDDDDISQQGPRLLNQKIEKFIQSVIACRKEYIEFHRNNPGIFYETIFVDDRDLAMKKLETLLKDAVKRSATPWHTYSFEKDPCFEEMMSDRLSNLYAQLQNRYLPPDTS